MVRRSLRSWSSLVALLVALAALSACGSSDHADADAFCRHYQAAANAGAAISDVDAVSLDEFKAHVATSADEANAAAEVAPSDVRDAAKRLARTADELRDASERARDRTALEGAVADYVKQAQAHRDDADQVARWAATNCGLNTASPTTTSTTAAPLVGQG